MDKFINKKIVLPNYMRKTILFMMMFIILFKITIASLDLGKGVIILAILYLVTYNGKVKNVLQYIGMKQYGMFFLLGIVWTSGLIYRDIFFPKNEMSSYLSSKEMMYISFYIIVLPFFCVFTFKSFNEFSKIVIAIMLLQSSIVILSMVLGPIKKILSFYYAGNKEVLYYMSANIKGVSFGIIGANGSVALLMGQILLILLMLDNKISWSKFLIEYLIIMAAEALSGRTGFYFSIIFLAFYILTERRICNIKKNILLLPTLFLIFCGITALIIYIWAPDMIEKWIYRIFEIFIGIFGEKNGGATINAIQNMSHPELTVETLFGTSVTRGVSYNGTVFNNDSGYWQKYFALGLIGALFYYMGYLTLFLGTIKRLNTTKHRSFFLFCVIMLFIMEYKEPFIGYGIYPMMIMTILIFYLKQSDLEKI